MHDDLVGEFERYPTTKGLTRFIFPWSGGPKGCIAKRKKVKGNREKDISCVNYYNDGKNGHYARDCPEPTKVPTFTVATKKFVWSHAFVANIFPYWIRYAGGTYT